MKRLLVLNCALALAACGSASEGSFETEDGGEGTYSVDADGDGSSVNIRTEEGELNIRSGADLDVDLPAGFDLYRGSTVVTNSSVKHEQGNMTAVMIVVKEDPAVLAEYYRGQAGAAGYEISTEVKTGAMIMFGGKNGAGENFSFNANPNEDGETVAQLSFVKEAG